jgi:hypothetical protein
MNLGVLQARVRAWRTHYLPFLPDFVEICVRVLCQQPTSKFSCDKRVSYVKGWYGVNITCRTTLALNIYLCVIQAL